MKRILALLCLFSLLLSLVSCSSSIAIDETGEAKTGENQTAEAEKATGDIVYPECFAVGFGRGDITPTEFPIPIYNRDATGVHDPLMLTCTAVWDGESAALLFTADLKSCSRALWDKSAKIIEKQFGIPKDRVFFNTTHTHNAHDPGLNNENISRWQSKFYQIVPVVVEEALRDLDEAEAYVSKGKTEGITFVRRYLLASGKYQTNPGSEDNPVAHETEADNELRTIRFDRKNKKDVLLVNYQTHYGGATSAYPGLISSDFVGNFRTSAEEELDVLFSFHNGAGGNLNFNSAIPGEKKYDGWIPANQEFMDVTRAALASEKKVEVGKIQANISYYKATVLKDSPEVVAHAKEVNSYPKESQKYNELVAQYGLGNARRVSAIITRNSMGATQEIVIMGISFGDISFTTVPIEQFDENAKWVRDNSPFEMTFTCSMTNGSYGYVPTLEASAHGGYEVLTTRFVYGSGEEFAQEQLRLLNECKKGAEQ